MDAAVLDVREGECFAAGNDRDLPMRRSFFGEAAKVRRSFSLFPVLLGCHWVCFVLEPASVAVFSWRFERIGIR